MLEETQTDQAMQRLVEMIRERKSAATRILRDMRRVASGHELTRAAARIIELIEKRERVKTQSAEIRALIEKRRAEGWGWQFDGLENWSTEAIFEQLRKLHIDTDAELFPQQAAAAGRFEKLSEDWCEQIPQEMKDEDPWEDFPSLAIRVLWQRLAPHVICADLIDERLQLA